MSVDVYLALDDEQWRRHYRALAEMQLEAATQLHQRALALFFTPEPERAFVPATTPCAQREGV